MLRIIILCLCIANSVFTVAKNYGGNYDWRMLGGGPLQVVSLHIGSHSNLSNNGHTGYSIGASIGWNYLSSFYGLFKRIDHVFDMGFRIKYDFIQDSLQKHNVGAELQFHFPYSTSNAFRNIPQPISGIIGAGLVFAYKDSMSSSIRGNYMEIGIGFIKFLPFNMNITYRWSFFPNNQNNLLRIEKSLHVIFTIF
ncbi:hypothetical protein LS73_002255 [Helicobacter muridarum]|uniref:Outer membrane protein n=1 Tax=Helicobacter muridarum TaxID=216 RepID=A0A099TXS8_9HELI|nr:hypothetical protein [Helicobacter muridarum]TLE01117.1 hypothetical protein LS73_002255 [Helicobacter muridarum]STQ85985.1 Uncharacterised protein [Helicobacter muridarum]